MIRRLGQLALLVTAASTSLQFAPPVAKSSTSEATPAETVVVRTSGNGRWGAPRLLVALMTIGALDGPPEYALGEIGALAVGPTGLIYLLDDGPVIREYSAAGQYRRDIGRVGSGPGEYRRPDGAALAVAPGGDLLVRDPGNGRIVAFRPDGSSVTWPISGRSNGRPLFVDTAGVVHTPVLLEYNARNLDQEFGLVRFRANGAPFDTIPVPDWRFRRPFLLAGSDRGSSVRDLPYAPEPVWTFSPHGYLIGGVNTDYRIDLFRKPGSVLRIERDIQPTPISAAEADDHRRVIIESVRLRHPGWRWNGPPIPKFKPAFRDLFPGQDGRIWVLTSEPSIRVPVDEAAAGNGRRDGRWREPLAFDVFEPTGAYLGRALAPDGMLVDPVPVFRGDTVWAAWEGLDGVHYIKRMVAAGR